MSLRRLIARFGIRIMDRLGIVVDEVDLVVNPTRPRTSLTVVVVEGPVPRGLIVQRNPGVKQ